MERPPLLLNEANHSLLANVLDLSASGLKEMGLLAMQQQNGNRIDKKCDIGFLF